jgi:adenylate kinase
VYVILLGAPGAGKGTQAEVISRRYDLCHLSTGDLFRETVAKGAELAETIKTYIDRGELVPDEITIRVVVEHLRTPACRCGVVFDGFPRTLNQARELKKALAAEGKQIDVVIDIEVSTDELLERLEGRYTCRICMLPYHVLYKPPKVTGVCDACGGELYHRTDDHKLSVMVRRMEIYREQTAPLIKFYQREGLLRPVAGDQLPDDVGVDVLDITDEVAEKVAHRDGSGA